MLPVHGEDQEAPEESINHIVLDYEIPVRLLFFFGLLILTTLWEFSTPRRRRSSSRITRWPINMGMVLIDSLALRFLMPVTAISAAAYVETHGFGLLVMIPSPQWLSLPLGIVILDLAIYAQHVMFHTLAPLWRLHMVHHTDLDIDVTTGVRFHPIEVILSMGIKASVVAVMGIPPLAVLIFEILLNGTSIFNHGNIRLSGPVDRALRLFLVTPDMHRVHHSVITGEMNSNFGFNLPWWDRLFATYRAQPSAGHDDMMIGIARFRDPKRLTLPYLLLLPFTFKPHMRKGEDGDS